MFERILVPLDGSSSAEITLPYVTQIASKFGSQIVLVRVAESFGLSLVNACRTYLNEVTDKLKDQLKEWQAKEETKVSSQLLIGTNPASEILNYANEMTCDLIVLASRGQSGQGPWPLGSVAIKILRASRFPALLIRNRVDDSLLEQKKLFRKILVPLDGSKLSEAAVPEVVSLSKAIGGEIVLFQVIEHVTVARQTTGAEIAWHTISDIESRIRSEVVGYLNRLKETLQREVTSVTTAVAEGSPADKIIDYSQSNNIDLIAMSTHGRSGIGRWVFGSVTEKVLQSGDKAVLVVRPKENVV